MPLNIRVFTDGNFEQDVLRANLPVLVDFWAPWCGPCRIVAPMLEELAKEFTGKVIVGGVNTDENRALAQKYQIRSIPTLLLFKNGNVTDQLVGLRRKEELIEAFHNIFD